MDNKTISRLIYPSRTTEDIVIDFYQLALFRGEPKNKCRVGADFVNFFTHPERLNTIGREGISFIEFINNKNSCLEKRYVQRMLDFYDSEPPEREIWILYRIFNLYFGAISLFQPHIAVSLFDRFKPKCVLSPCAGWGGLVTGACAAGVPRWIGCDSNPELIKPYELMIETLTKHSLTKIDMHYGDCLNLPYAKMEYDMVLYSPPFYNIEQYNGQPFRLRHEWNHFYIVLCELSWQHLQVGGWYCIAVSNEIYDIYKQIIGRIADYVVGMPNKKRHQFHKYGENIFCWRR